MLYSKAVIETPSIILPPDVVTSEQLEIELKPAYDRIGLHVGRLELMTGIKERRRWKPGTLPSEQAAAAGLKALEMSNIDKNDVNCVINCSVSRDCVEPATAAFVHHLMDLPETTMNFDISNACLGVASGILTLAAMVEAGMIDTGLAVSAENGAPLVANTIKHLNNTNVTRQSIKPHFASLTIGSCATAVVVRRNTLSTDGHELIASACLTDSSHNDLCKGDAAGGMTDDAAPLMQTDSPVLMANGVKLAQKMWSTLKNEANWNDDTPHVICTHQVGKGHRALLYELLNLDLAKDFSTFETLGNCGSASLTATLATAAQQNAVAKGQHVALLGIGSGINCCGFAVRW